MNTDYLFDQMSLSLTNNPSQLYVEFIQRSIRQIFPDCKPGFFVDSFLADFCFANVCKTSGMFVSPTLGLLPSQELSFNNTFPKTDI